MQSHGAVRNKTPLLGQVFYRLSSPYSPHTAHCYPLRMACILRVSFAIYARARMLPE